MALVSRHIPALFNGVSQQPPTLRQPAQGEMQLNCYSTVAEGLKKRAPFQHIAKVTTANWDTAFIHAINRDSSERYIVVVTDGDLKVFDANDGTEETVNFPQGKTYLDVVGAASASFSIVSIADYSFVCNKEKIVATKTAPASVPLQYNNWYTPPVWQQGDQENYYSPYGAGILTGRVNTFSDLPKPSDPQPPSNGDLYKVEGLDERAFGGYYVRRVAGVWEETYGPGENLTLDETTMPWALVRESNGTFSFTTFAWKARRFGDAETNPPPTFVGRNIQDVFYWKNRLGMLTGENVVLSCAGDYGNFWRNTATTILDADVIDVAVSTNQVTELEFAVPFNNGLMLFSDQAQFSLNTGDLLTANTVSIDQVTSYQMDSGVRPVGIGSDVYFCSRSGPFTKVREYFVSEGNLTLDAADVTAHVPRYIPKGITKLAGNDNEDVLFAISDEPTKRNFIYCYKRFWQGDKKLQSAWSEWYLNPTDVVLSIDIIENRLYCLLKKADGVFLNVCDLDDGAVVDGLDFDIMIDERYAVQPGDMTYNAANDTTTLTMPYNESGVDNATLRVVYSAGTGNKGRLESPQFYTISGATITVPGNITTFAPYVGTAYPMGYQFSEQFMMNGQGQAITTGRLQLRTMTLYYQDAGYFEVRVLPYGEKFAEKIEPVAPALLDTFTGRTVGDAALEIGDLGFETGAYQFYIDGNSRDAIIRIVNDSHLQSKFSSAEWEGMYFNRSRSV
tara:strand:- start:14616 stop:16811 length:2196 start_codon:yes stop_codon:yes gene_type:complete